jgi:hypothetical protein
MPHGIKDYQKTHIRTSNDFQNKDKEWATQEGQSARTSHQIFSEIPHITLYEISNGITLCVDCHFRLHGK